MNGLQSCFLAAVLFCNSGGCKDNYCQQLDKTSPNGVILSRDEARCQDLLDFANDVSDRYQMGFAVWINTVAAQRTVMVFEVTRALTLGDRQVTSFAMEPAEVACAPGIPTKQAFPIDDLKLVFNPPEQLYVSFSLEVDESTSIATMRTFQDFNCDHQIAVQELVGEFHRGLDPLGGGWRTIRSFVPPIDQ